MGCVEVGGTGTPELGRRRLAVGAAERCLPTLITLLAEHWEGSWFDYTVTTARQNRVVYAPDVLVAIVISARGVVVTGNYISASAFTPNALLVLGAGITVIARTSNVNMETGVPDLTHILCAWIAIVAGAEPAASIISTCLAIANGNAGSACPVEAGLRFSTAPGTTGKVLTDTFVVLTDLELARTGPVAWPTAALIVSTCLDET